MNNLPRQKYRLREDGVQLYITKSPNNFYIIQNETGAKYDIAIDVEDAPYTYSETDEPIEIIEIIPEVEPDGHISE